MLLKAASYLSKVFLVSMQLDFCTTCFVVAVNTHGPTIWIAGFAGFRILPGPWLSGYWW